MSESSVFSLAALQCGADSNVRSSAAISANWGSTLDGSGSETEEHQRLVRFQVELMGLLRSEPESARPNAIHRCLVKHMQPLQWIQARMATVRNPAPAVSGSGTEEAAQPTIEIEDCLAKWRLESPCDREIGQSLRTAISQLAASSLLTGRISSVTLAGVPRAEISPTCSEELASETLTVLSAIVLSEPGTTSPPTCVVIATCGLSATLALAMLSTYGQSLQQLTWARWMALSTGGAQVRRTLSRGNQDLERTQRLPEAATALLTRWAEHWRLSHLAWVSVDGSRRPRVVAISGAMDVDPVSRLALDLVATTQRLMADEGPVARWSTPTIAPPKFHHRDTKSNTASGNDPALATCLQSIANELMAPAVLAWPCRGADGVMAYLFLVGPAEIAAPDWTDTQAAELSDLRAQIRLADRIHEPLSRRLLARPLKGLRRWKWYALAAVALLTLLAFWPTPYTMDCSCELATTDRRYAVAPYQGTLQQVFVKPGDVVAAGAVLATMDDRELRIELAGQQAAFEREKNQIASWRASGDLAKARIAELEAERIRQEIALLNHHLAHREIRAPIDGTIVQGDLVELMGAPVEIGNNLFEVAGLSDLLVQVEIPEYQYRFAQPGQTVRLYLEAFPYEVFTGQVERLHPRATTREERNVFLAELRLPNGDHKLRPGMKGRAQVTGDAFPLAWKWLHYPYEKARSFVGWF